MIRIITHSTSGLPASLAQQYDIPLIPQVIMFGDESYLEGVEMDHAVFLSRLRTAKDGRAAAGAVRRAVPAPGQAGKHGALHPSLG